MSIKSSFLGVHQMGESMRKAIASLQKKDETKLENKASENIPVEKISYAEAEKIGFVKTAKALGRNAFESTCELGKAFDEGSIWQLIEENGQKFFIKNIDEAGSIVRKVRANRNKSVKVTFAGKVVHCPIVVKANYKNLFGVTPEEVEKGGKEIGEDTEDEGYITKFYDFNGKSYFISKAVGDNLVASFGEIESEPTKEVKAESMLAKIKYELKNEIEKNDKRDGMPFDVSGTLGGETEVYDFNIKEDFDAFKKDIGELGYEVVSMLAGVATIQKKRTEEAVEASAKYARIVKAEHEVPPYTQEEIQSIMENAAKYLNINMNMDQAKELSEILFKAEVDAQKKNEHFTDFDWKNIVENYIGPKQNTVQASAKLEIGDEVKAQEGQFEIDGTIAEIKNDKVTVKDKNGNAYDFNTEGVKKASLENKEIKTEAAVKTAEEKPEEQVFKSSDEAVKYLNDKRAKNEIPTDKIYEPKQEGDTYRLQEKKASKEVKAEDEEIDDNAAEELYMYATNDGDLYRQMLRPIQKNLINKKASGVYNKDLALKAFIKFMQFAAQKYTQEFGSAGDKWYIYFPVEVRRAAAVKALEYFETEAGLGNYDNYLFKKYQKKPEAPKAETPIVEASVKTAAVEKINNEKIINSLVKKFTEGKDKEEAEDIKEEITNSFNDQGRWGDWGISGSFTAEGQEYNWVLDEDEAEEIALKYVTQTLEEEPELFNQEWLKEFRTMSDTDRRIIADEEADARLDGMDEADILAEAGEEDESKIEEAKEKLQQKYYEEIYEELSDPHKYFVEDQGQYSEEDFAKASFMSLDIKKAAKSAVDIDSFANFLSLYDGGYEMTSDGIVYFRE